MRTMLLPLLLIAIVAPLTAYFGFSYYREVARSGREQS